MVSIFLMAFTQLFRLCFTMLKLQQEMSSKLLDEGIYVMGFYYPVVPRNKGSNQSSKSSVMEKYHLDKAIMSFKKVGKAMGFNLSSI